jgi:hypothetical protein
MPKTGTRFAVLATSLLFGTALFGLLVRLRILFTSPLPSDQPVRWLLLGVLGDVALVAAVSAAVLLLARIPSTRLLVSPVLLAAFTISGVALFLQSELIVYFGHPPRRGDLSPGSLVRFVRASFDAGACVRLAIAVTVLAALATLASRRASRALFSRATPGRLALASLAAFTLALIPVPVHLRRTTEHPIFLLAEELRAGSLVPGDGRRPGYRPLDVKAGDFLPFPPPRANRGRSGEAPRLPEGLKPNIVFVLLEGVRSRELGAWGGGVPGLSPNLDALSKEGIRVDRAYSPGTHTPEGELGLWYGMMATPQALIMTDRPDLPGKGLPEILRAAGWRSFLWIHSGDQTFYQRDRFYRPRGFLLIDGRDFPPSDPRTNWGYSDKALMRRSLRALDSLAEPFAAMILTVSNHHPFEVPGDAQTSFEPPLPVRAGFLKIEGLPQLLGLHTGGMLKTIHYTDEAVGDFFAAARTKAWFRRTLFVVAGDHGLPIAPLSGTPTAHEFDELRHRVPLVLFSPLLPAGVTVAGPASLYDVTPTLLGLLGLPVPAEMPGRDLLDPAAAADTPVIAWNDDGRVVTAATRRFVWHTTLEEGTSTLLSDERLYAAADARGERDLLRSEPEVSESIRARVRAWLTGYFAGLERLRGRRP